MPLKLTVQRENVTLDLLLWREYGVRGQDLLEEALALNTGLAALGAILPIGTAVTLSDLPPAPRATSRKVVSLFG